MCKMWTVVTILTCNVSLSLDVCIVQKQLKYIKVLFGVKTLGDPSNIVLDGGLSPLTGRGMSHIVPFRQI